MMPMKFFGKSIVGSVLISAGVLLSGCGGGSGGGSTSPKASGHYYDSAVEGIHYQCGRESGTTDAQGMFYLEENRSCIFSLNGVTIREVNGSKIFDGVVILEENATVASLLLTLDEDGNAGNGISIGEDELACVEEPLDVNAVYQCLENNVSDYNGTYVDEGNASKHLQETRKQYVPVATSASLTIDEDQNLTHALNVSDPNGDSVSCSVIEAPGHGTASLDGCELHYTPASNFNGLDRLKYIAKDSTGLVSDPAEINITITPVNDVPVLQAISNQNLNEDFGTKTIELNASDVDGDALTYSVSVADTNVLGASVSGHTLSLTSIPNANGSTQVTVTVDDGHGGSDSKSFRVTITPVNDDPVLQQVDNQNLNEDFGTKTIELNASDVDGDTLTYSVSVADTSVVNASVSGHTLSLTSIPNANGSTQVTVTVDDGHGGSDSKSFRVTITPVNDDPVLQQVDNQNLNEDFGTKTIELNASDVDGDALTYSVSVADTNVLGASVSGHTLSLTSIPNANGSTQVTVTVSDGHGGSDTMGFNVNVNPVNDAPVLEPIADQNLSEDFGTKTIELNATDVDGDDLNYSVSVADTSVVNASVSGHTLSLTSIPNANGSTQVTVTVNDGHGGSNSKSFTVTVNPVNDAPVAENFRTFIETNSTGNIIDLSGHISDPDGDALHLVSFDQLSGLSEESNTSFRYDNDGTEGTFQVHYTVADPSGEEANATMTIVVSQTPVIPVANDDNITINEDTPVDIDVMANDINGSAISEAHVISGGGNVTISGKKLHYVPAPNYNGTAKLEYTLRSTTGDEDTATVTVTITPVNDQPVIDPIPDQNLSEDFGNVSIQVNATDPDGTSLRYGVDVSDDRIIAAEISAEGLLTLHSVDNANGNVTVTVHAYGTGGIEDQSQYSFTVTVNPVNDAPVANDDVQRVEKDQSTTIDVLSNDEDPDGDDLNITSVTAPDHGGSAQINGKKILYTPADGFTGTERFRYTISDGEANATATVTVQVYDPNNRPPEAHGGHYTVERDQILQRSLDAYDPDGQAITYTVTTPPEHGSVIVDEDGYFTYEPADTYVGADSFVCTVSDGELDTNATVTITVRPSEHEEHGDDDEIPITAEEFNATQAATIPIGQKHYYIDMNEDHDKVEVGVHYYVFRNDGTVYDSEENKSWNYSVDQNTHTAALDFDDDGEADFKWKYIGETNATKWLQDHNLTMPQDAEIHIYEGLDLEIHEEYDLFDHNVSRECNESGCSGSYATLEDYFDAVTFRKDVQDVWKDLKEIWIGGYGFMLAEGSDMNDGNGTLVRVGRYYDHDQNKGVAKITLSDAGTWELRTVDGTQYLVVTPSVYDIHEVRIFAVKDGAVKEGEYLPPNRATREYTFDETTAYLLANARMPRKVDLDRKLQEGEYDEFVSFENLPAIDFIQDLNLSYVSTDEDNGTITAKQEKMRFDSNGTWTFRGNEGDDDMEEADYTLSGNVATIEGMGDVKFVAAYDDAQKIAELTGLSTEALGEDPHLYQLAYVNGSDNIEAWQEAFEGTDGNTYGSIDDFMTAFKKGKVVATRTKDELYAFKYGGDINETAGILALYDNEENIVNPNAGTWELKTIDGKDTVIFSYAVAAHDPNAAVVSGNCGNHVCKADFEAKDTGDYEYWFDEATGDTVANYLNNHQIEFHSDDNEKKIRRQVQGLALSDVHGKKLYNAYNGNDGNCHSYVTGYIQVDTGAETLSVVYPDKDETFDYNTVDGIVMNVEEDGTLFMHAKVKKVMDAKHIERYSGLVVPPGVSAYRIQRKDLGKEGKDELRFEQHDLIYYESYLLNNPEACDEE